MENPEKEIFSKAELISQLTARNVDLSSQRDQRRLIIQQAKVALEDAEANFQAVSGALQENQYFLDLVSKPISKEK